MLSVGSLFAGIGGFDLGFERTGGFRTAWFCERDDFCRRVLERHWPGVPCYDDVCALSGADVEPVDVLCGGFPCQDISLAGKGAGIAGARSGLWSEYARLVGELRPRYIVVENVTALLGRGLDRVLADLAALGFDAEWDCLPASAVGAPHRRDRLWIVAYPADPDAHSEGRSVVAQHDGGSNELGGRASGRHADRLRDEMADTSSFGRERPGQTRQRRSGSPDGGRGGEQAGAGIADWWKVEPDVGRVVDGFPGRVDRLRALGNSLVPHVAQWIGERILAYERGRVNLAK